MSVNSEFKVQGLIESYNPDSKPLGGTKHNKDKVDVTMIPSIAILEESKALMVGEKKYGRWNFEKGFKTSDLIGAALRHIYAYLDGESHCPVDKQHHLGAARASLGMLLRLEQLNKVTDDRSPNGAE